MAVFCVEQIQCLQGDVAVADGRVGHPVFILGESTSSNVTPLLAMDSVTR